jgi:single-strand DNA-binding protein
LLRAHNAALRLHPSGLIALRTCGCTLSLLSFFPFFLLEKCFYGRPVKKEVNKMVSQLKLKNMNIIGRLTRDAQISTLPDEKQVVNFSVAVNDSYRNKQGERVEHTGYFNCAYWISTNVAKVLTKGTLVELSGRVSARAWIGGDGEAHAALNFHTSQIKLHEGGKRPETVAGGNRDNSAVPADNGTDDLPF